MFGILVVENNSFVAGEIKNWLVEEGYKVDISPAGTQALRFLQDNEYDLAVIDIYLPDMEGVELCKRIVSSNLRIPVMMVSARPGVEDTVKGLDAGAQDFMTMPLELQEFSARIRSLLRRYSRQGLPRAVVRPEGEHFVNVSPAGTNLPLINP